jgi:hypothetical protein
VGGDETYRIAITRTITSGSSVRWQSEIDQLYVRDYFGSEEDARQTWIRPTGIPSRLLGDTPEMALRDAMRWLSDWAGFDEKGRERRAEEDALRMEPRLKELVTWIDESVEPDVDASWRDERRARWSTDKYDFFVSRDSAEQAVLMTYSHNKSKVIEPPWRFPFSREGAYEAADRIRARALDA